MKFLPYYLLSVASVAPFTRADDGGVISSGSYHTCVVLFDGQVACWGDNQHGQCDAPTDIVFSQVSAGWSHTCGLERDTGAAVCWGLDVHGEATPPEETLFSQIVSGQGWSCGIEINSGRVQCWGYDGNAAIANAPGEDAAFVELAGGVEHVCGKMTSGALSDIL